MFEKSETKFGQIRTFRWGKPRTHGRYPLKGDPKANPHPKQLSRLIELASMSGLLNDRDPTDRENREFLKLFDRVMATGYRFKGVEPWMDDDCHICIEMKKVEIHQVVFPETGGQDYSDLTKH